MTNCYIFDLDGTLADLSHRLHHIQKQPKDWRAFFGSVMEDAPIPHMVNLYRQLSAKHGVIIVSGRSDECWKATMDWLAANALWPDAVYMRTAGDHRPDYLVKYDLLQRILSEGWKPVMAFDDRDQVVKMWRENGIPCAQVAEGSF